MASVLKRVAAFASLASVFAVNAACLPPDKQTRSTLATYPSKAGTFVARVDQVTGGGAAGYSFLEVSIHDAKDQEKHRTIATFRARASVGRSEVSNLRWKVVWLDDDRLRLELRNYTLLSAFGEAWFPEAELSLEARVAFVDYDVK